MGSRRSQFGVSLIRAVVWATAGLLVGGLFWFVASSTGVAAVDGPVLAAAIGAGIGLLLWGITAVIRSRGKRNTLAPSDEQAPEFGMTRGGFKDTRLPGVSTQKMRASAKTDTPVARMPHARNTNGRRKEIAIVLGVVLMIGVLVGAFFGRAELVSAFGSFNLAIYGTVTLVLILVIIIAVLESKD